MLEDEKENRRSENPGLSTSSSRVESWARLRTATSASSD
jgi:hypothetical protein